VFFFCWWCVAKLHLAVKLRCEQSQRQARASKHSPGSCEQLKMSSDFSFLAATFSRDDWPALLQWLLLFEIVKTIDLELEALRSQGSFKNSHAEQLPPLTSMLSSCQSLLICGRWLSVRLSNQRKPSWTLRMSQNKRWWVSGPQILAHKGVGTVMKTGICGLTVTPSGLGQNDQFRHDFRPHLTFPIYF